MPCRSWDPLPIQSHDPQVQQTFSRLGSQKHSGEKTKISNHRESICVQQNGKHKWPTYIHRPWEGIMLKKVKVLNVKNPDRPVIVSGCQPSGSTGITFGLQTISSSTKYKQIATQKSTESYLGS